MNLITKMSSLIWTWIQRCNHSYELDYKDVIIDLNLISKMKSLIWTWFQRWNHWYELDFKDVIIDMNLISKMKSLIWTWFQRWNHWYELDYKDEKKKNCLLQCFPVLFSPLFSRFETELNIIVIVSKKFNFLFILLFHSMNVYAVSVFIF